MPDTRHLQSLVDAAERAAAVGDHVAAERLLREVAALQEASLGPHHPDLARTLNNLGVACEMAGNPAAAERCFRRAADIAAAVLDPDHPFVATSRKNLEDFRAARARTVPLPDAISTTIAAAGRVWAARARDLPRNQPTRQVQSRPPASSRWEARHVIATVIAASLLLTLAVTAWFRWSDPAGSGRGARSPASSTPAPESSSVGTGPSKTLAETPDRSGGASAEGQQPAPAATAGDSTAAESPGAGSSIPQAPVVVAAQLCRTLSTGGRRSSAWRCVPPEGPPGPGVLFFYTRLKSPTAITVQHRWYRAGSSPRVVELSIRANMIDGYRTYSRHRIDAQGPGDWTVELTTSDGTVLHEERFVVR